jgi:hypothetical protein
MVVTCAKAEIANTDKSKSVSLFISVIILVNNAFVFTAAKLVKIFDLRKFISLY